MRLSNSPPQREYHLMLLIASNSYLWTQIFAITQVLVQILTTYIGNTFSYTFACFLTLFTIPFIYQFNSEEVKLIFSSCRLPFKLKKDLCHSQGQKAALYFAFCLCRFSPLIIWNCVGQDSYFGDRNCSNSTDFLKDNQCMQIMVVLFCLLLYLDVAFLFPLYCPG